MNPLKKFIPALGFAKRPSAASSAGPQVTPEDWVRQAMDTVIALGVTDGRIPSSIGDVACIFTQMLRQLQEMKANRDDFYQITKDIGNLIESAIRYAREYDATSQVFVKVCDDFLSTISSIQSWMVQIYCDSTMPMKLLTKIKPYKGALCNYQSQIWRLRSDLHALTFSSSSSSSSTGILSNARVVTITGGTIADVQGNQTIFHNHGTIIQTLHPERIKTDGLDLSDYRVFKYGDLHSISVPRKRLGMQEFTVSINNEIMTARTYTGKDSLKSFTNDIRIIQGQKFRNTFFLQLFGVCLSETVPTLIFHRDHKHLDYVLHPEPRENWRQKFRAYREWQAACRYLVQDCQLRAAHRYLMQADQLGNWYTWVIPLKENDDDGSWHLYLDHSGRLQVSIESPNKLRDYRRHVTRVPKLSSYEMEAIEFSLSHGTLHDACQIDKKACLLAIYDMVSWPSPTPLFDLLAFHAFILVSPMKRAGAARLIFDCEHHFEWTGWYTINGDGLSIDMSSIAIENNFWTRFTMTHHFSSVHRPCHWCSVIKCYSHFNAPSLYFKTWLAQAARIKHLIRLLCASRERMMLVTCVGRSIDFQCCFSPLSNQNQGPVFLFVKDPQNVDDLFDITWFWAKDPKGLEPLSQTDVVSLGLREPYLSKIYVQGRPERLREPRLPNYDKRQDLIDHAIWAEMEEEELRTFHEALGFAADSPDIPHFLDLPTASVEWDGDENGPLTPWELIQAE